MARNIAKEGQLRRKIRHTVTLYLLQGPWSPLFRVYYYVVKVGKPVDMWKRGLARLRRAKKRAPMARVPLRGDRGA